MSKPLPFKIEEDPEVLAQLQGWNATVYADLMAVQSGELSQVEFRKRYVWTKAILVLDMTGFTSSSIERGDVGSLLRILNAQKVCVPVLEEHGSELTHCFADDILAIFDEPRQALEAALEIHRRIARFNESDESCDFPAECCIGLGYGELLKIGPNLAQGTEINMASKLGEDIARANEILLTESAFNAIGETPGVRFERQRQDDQLFAFYSARHSMTP